MNKFVHQIDAFYSNEVYYRDSDSLYMPVDHNRKVKEAGYVGNNFGQGKNDYGDGGIFFGLFLGPKLKICQTLDIYGTLREKPTFKRFHDFCLPWKRSFTHGIPNQKKRNYC